LTPFEFYSEENLRAALGRMGVNSRAMEDVIDKARNRHYQVGLSTTGWTSVVHNRLIWYLTICMTFMQLACTLTFEALHGMPCDAGINHPNQYFSDSRKILQSKVGYSFNNHNYKRASFV